MTEIDPDYAPEAAYSLAEDEFTELLNNFPAETEEIVEMLEHRLTEAINNMEMASDEDEASAQLQNIVLRLQTLAFIAGSIWKEMQIALDTGDQDNPVLFDSLSINITDTQKLELTRNLLNGDGISLKIL